MATAMTNDEYYRRLRVRMTYEVMGQALAAGVVTFSGAPVPGYPPGYQDPDWDGTTEGFQTVIDARSAALADSMSGVLSPSMAFAWDEAPPAVTPATRPVTLAAAAIAGDSHIWVTELLPAACGHVMIGDDILGERHLLDLSMIRSHDGPGRHAVWLETTLSQPWPTGTRITVG